MYVVTTIHVLSFREAFHSVILDLHGNGEHLFKISGNRKMPAHLVTGVSSDEKKLELV